ncbi:MAG: RING finger domain-containing protein [Candidatus Neptunochlamydia sp.]|nr:RING finger domain-containing protein [Candidatus Neptunochlamydia sp.]
METLKVPTKTWDCPICSDVMDGEANGLVSISKRCFHVFHETCIKKWVGEHNNTCPCCKLENFSVIELIPNPDFAMQYKAWKANPDEYSFQKAFAKIFAENYLDPTQDMNLLQIKPSDVLRPESLRGKARREELTNEEIDQYYEHSCHEIDKIRNTNTQQEIDLVGKNYHSSEALVLKQIAKQQQVLKKQNIQQFSRLDKIQESQQETHKIIDDIGDDFARERKKTEHINFAKTFIDKLEAFDALAEAEIKRLETQNPVNYSSVRAFRSFLTDLSKYRERFRVASQTSYTDPKNPSPEESPELLCAVNQEMEALVDSQSEEVRAVLRPESVIEEIVWTEQEKEHHKEMQEKIKTFYNILDEKVSLLKGENEAKNKNLIKELELSIDDLNGHYPPDISEITDKILKKEAMFVSALKTPFEYLSILNSKLEKAINRQPYRVKVLLGIIPPTNYTRNAKAFTVSVVVFGVFLLMRYHKPILAMFWEDKTINQIKKDL